MAAYKEAYNRLFQVVPYCSIMSHWPISAVVLWLSLFTVAADDVLVFLKVSDDTNLEGLINLPGTIALYKVQRVNVYTDLDPYEKNEYKPGNYEETVWNYVLLGEGFGNCVERSQYIKDASSFSFVDGFKSVDLKSYSNLNTHNKHIEENMKRQDLMKRPLKPAVYNSSCSDLDFDEGMVFTIRLSKTRDERARQGYTGLMMDKVYPALGVQYFYAGSVDSTVCLRFCFYLKAVHIFLDTIALSISTAEITLHCKEIG